MRRLFLFLNILGLTTLASFVMFMLLMFYRIVAFGGFVAVEENRALATIEFVWAVFAFAYVAHLIALTIHKHQTDKKRGKP